MKELLRESSGTNVWRPWLTLIGVNSRNASRYGLFLMSRG